MIVKKFRAGLGFAMLALVSCIGPRIVKDFTARTEPPVRYPACSFFVLSDIHYYSPELGTTGRVFEEYLASDRKLLRESSEIFAAVLGRLKGEAADFVLVCGDLTKDGERINHERVAAELATLEQTGKKVYVIPGNHDVLNYRAYAYGSSGRSRVATVTPEDFTRIYGEFGYDEAFARDDNSLSYVVEPVPGLWIFGLDACRYDENREGNESKSSGRFKKETVVWVTEMLARAASGGKAVMGFMHHGLLEHFAQQAKYVKSAAVKDGDELGRLLAESGMKVIFTGHFHAQDITGKKFKGGGAIFDIETGSLVTYPCPYRIVTITDQVLKIESRFVDSIAAHGAGFPDFAAGYLQSGIEGIGRKYTANCLFGRSEGEKLAADVAGLLSAHYRGDEDPGDRHVRPHGCASSCLLITANDLVAGLEKDLMPPDNNIVIDLETGAWW